MGLVYQTAYFLTRALAHCCFDYRVFNREAIPPSGGLILAMNHQSFLDPPFAGICCNRELFFLARKTLFDVPVLGFFMKHVNVIGVDREGSDVGALKAVIRVLRSGGCTVVFPEGTRSRDGNLLPARPGAGLIIAKTLAPVIPMRIFGAFEAFPPGSKWPRCSPVTTRSTRPSTPPCRSPWLPMTRRSQALRLRRRT